MIDLLDIDAHAPRSAGVVRHPQSAARDRHGRHLRLPARAAARTSASTVIDHGAGAVSLLAVRGTPKRLFNVHLDTVPDSPAWSAIRTSCASTAIARSASAPATSRARRPALLAAARATRGRRRVPVHHRRGGQRCALHRRRSSRATTRFGEVIVAEPTRCEAVLAHRGISSVLMRFTRPGRPRLRQRRIERQRAAPGDALGRARARLRRSAGAPALRRTDRAALQHRPRRGRHQGQHDRAERRAALRLPAAAVAGHRRAARAVPRLRRCRRRSSYEETFRGPSLPAGDVAQAEARRLAARDLADALGLPIGNAVDFWTEASLFSAGRLRPRSCTAPATSRRRTPPTNGSRSSSCSATPQTRRAPHRGWTRMNADTHIQTRQTIVRLLSSMASAQGDRAVPQALLAARREALRRGQGRRRGAARRSRRADVVARVPAAGRPDADRRARRRPAARRGDWPPPASRSRPSTACA